MTVEIPFDFSQFLLEYFLSLPMKDSEQVVLTLRHYMAEAQTKASAGEEAAAAVQDTQ